MANANIKCTASNAFKKSLGGPAGAPPGAPPPQPVVAEEVIDFTKIANVALTPGQEAWLKKNGAAAWAPIEAARKTELMAMPLLEPSLKAAGLAAAGGRYNRKRNKRTKRNGNKGNKQRRTRQNKRKNRNKKTNKRR